MISAESKEPLFLLVQMDKSCKAGVVIETLPNVADSVRDFLKIKQNDKACKSGEKTLHVMRGRFQVGDRVRPAREYPSIFYVRRKKLKDKHATETLVFVSRAESTRKDIRDREV